jgi:cell division protein FtsQ
MSESRSRPQLRLALAPRPAPEAPTAAEEPAFFRPKNRLRVRRARRGWIARTVLVLEAAAVLLVVVSGAWTGYSKVMASETLRVGAVEVRGERFLSAGEVRVLLGPAVGENILTLDLEALKARLRASPWVADATVRRTLPDTLHVEIEERVPLALAEVERLYLMDGDGTLIDIYGPRTAAFDLPIVRGLGGLQGEARRDRAQRAGTLLRDLGELGAEVSEVHVEDSGELRLVLRGAGEVLRVGAPPYRTKFATFLKLRRELGERCPSAEYFDLRFRGRIYAREPEAAPGAGTGTSNAEAAVAAPAAGVVARND